MNEKVNMIFYNEMCKKIKDIESKIKERSCIGKNHSANILNKDLNISAQKEINTLIIIQFRREYTSPFEDFSSGNDNRLYGTKLENNFRNWLENRDPDYLDNCVQICATCNVPIKGIFLEHLAIASKLRLNRCFPYVERASKTKVDKDEKMFNLNQCVFMLTEFCNKKRDEATLLVAAWGLMNVPELNIKKASSIDKKYRSWLSGNTILIKDIRETFPHGWTKDQQENYLNQFPINIPENLQGEVR